MSNQADGGYYSRNRCSKKNLIDHIIALMHKPDCELCRKVYADEDPPCSKCIPPLKAENMLLVKIYNLVHNQIGINNASVFSVISRYINSFIEQEYCFDVLQEVHQQITQIKRSKNSQSPQTTNREQMQWLH